VEARSLSWVVIPLVYGIVLAGDCIISGCGVKEHRRERRMKKKGRMQNTGLERHQSACSEARHS
jgi:hypothetical protein